MARHVFLKLAPHMPRQTARRKTIKLKGYRKGRGRKLGKVAAAAVKKIVKKEVGKARSHTYKDTELGVFANDGAINAVVAVTQTPNDIRIPLNDVKLYDEDADLGDIIGKRHGDDIWIRGFKVTGTLMMDAHQSDMAEARVKVALISAKRSPLANVAPTNAPSIENDYAVSGEQWMFNDLNGAAPDEQQKVRYSKIQILAQKVISLRPMGKVDVSRRFTLQKWFKKPKHEEFNPADADGSNPLKRTYYLCVFASRDMSSTGAPISAIANVRKYFFTE